MKRGMRSHQQNERSVNQSARNCYWNFIEVSTTLNCLHFGDGQPVPVAVQRGSS